MTAIPNWPRRWRTYLSCTAADDHTFLNVLKTISINKITYGRTDKINHLPFFHRCCISSATAHIFISVSSTTLGKLIFFLGLASIRVDHIRDYLAVETLENNGNNFFLKIVILGQESAVFSLNPGRTSGLWCCWLEKEVLADIGCFHSPFSSSFIDIAWPFSWLVPQQWEDSKMTDCFRGALLIAWWAATSNFQRLEPPQENAQWDEHTTLKRFPQNVSVFVP